MFSSRLPWQLPRNRLSRLLDEKRRAGAELIDLTGSNPTRAGLHYPEAEILAALADERLLTYEPSPKGSLQAREAVAAYCSGRGQHVEPDQVLLTSSTSEAYSFLFKLLADPGDEVLVPRPSYPLFDFLASLESVAAVPYPLIHEKGAGEADGGGWKIDLEVLVRAAGPRAKAIVIVNPNNPTGSFLKRPELERILRFSAQRGLPIISDEVFSDYGFGEDQRRAASLAGIEETLVFCLSGLSKVAGLPQAKLAWIVMSGPSQRRLKAGEQLELIADTYLSVGAPVQHAAPRLLAVRREIQPQILGRCRGNLEALRSLVAGHPACGLLEPEGGWYATVRMPAVLGEEDWALTLLERDKVLTQPGYFYDFEEEPLLVISLLTPEESFLEGVRRLLARANG